MTKKCIGPCGQIKDITEFAKIGKNKDGSQKYGNFCAICKQLYLKEYYKNNKEKLSKLHKKYQEKNKPTILEAHKEYHKNNKEKIKEGHNKYYNDNKEEIIVKQKEYYEEHKDERQEYWKKYKEINNEKMKEQQKEYNLKEEVKLHRKDYVRKYSKEKYHNNIMHKLRVLMHSGIWRSLRGNKHGMSWEKLTGYTCQDLKDHLESKFDDKMNWENCGSYWHIDHIVPIDSFNFTSYDDEAFKKCWSLQNLQPLYGPDNISKGNQINEQWNNVELAAQLL